MQAGAPALRCLAREKLASQLAPQRKYCGERSSQQQ